MSYNQEHLKLFRCGHNKGGLPLERYDSKSRFCVSSFIPLWFLSKVTQGKPSPFAGLIHEACLVCMPLCSKSIQITTENSQSVLECRQSLGMLTRRHVPELQCQFAHQSETIHVNSILFVVYIPEDSSSCRGALGKLSNTPPITEAYHPVL